jgi:hypothetical protein
MYFQDHGLTRVQENQVIHFHSTTPTQLPPTPRQVAWLGSKQYSPLLGIILLLIIFFVLIIIGIDDALAAIFSIQTPGTIVDVSEHNIQSIKKPLNHLSDSIYVFDWNQYLFRIRRG